jgi:hypothetical protein
LLVRYYSQFGNTGKRCDENYTIMYISFISENFWYNGCMDGGDGVDRYDRVAIDKKTHRKLGMVAKSRKVSMLGLLKDMVNREFERELETIANDALKDGTSEGVNLVLEVLCGEGV